MATIQVQINKAFSGYVKDQVVSVEVDADGMPVHIEWRRRLDDAKIDGCCEVVKQRKKAAE